MRPEIVIYHGPGCADGFGAAFAIWRRFPEAAFIPAQYGQEPPDVSGKHVAIVDFSYSEAVLWKMSETAASIVVLDHHKTAQADLAVLATAEATWDDHAARVERGRGIGVVPMYARFDMEKSGCRLAWEFFHPGEAMPVLLRHIEDRDLWRFSMSGTRQISAVLYSYTPSFDLYESLVAVAEDSDGWHRLFNDGHTIDRVLRKTTEDAIRASRRIMVIGGLAVPVANVPHSMASDGARFLKVEPGLFVATYTDTAEGRRFSLRSTDEGADVSAIAKQYGGGGHRNAAGFTAPLGWEGDL